VAEYKYPLDNEWKGARERLSLLGEVWDPWTTRNFEKVGVNEGWRCLEIAAGGGSIAQWLCHRVGANGHVVATDLQPFFVNEIKASNLEVWRHDILSEPLPERIFDLVHARAVLTFLPSPGLAIAKMVEAVKPGGWLLLEEPDYISAAPDPSMTPSAITLSKKGWDALLRVLQSSGYDTAYGRHLYHDVAVNGIDGLRAEGFVSMQLGGNPLARFWKITFEQLQDQVLEAGLLTRAESEDYRALLDSPEYRWMNPIFMSVWGRRVVSK
jgi:SAM-dependent methyltransferase